MGLTPEQVTFFDENGYLLLGKLFTEEELERLRERAEWIASGQAEHVPEQCLQVEPRVAEGELTVEAGDDTQVVSGGHTVVVPPGTPHRLSNHGPAPVRMLAAAAWNHATFYREGSTYLEGEPRQ